MNQRIVAKPWGHEVIWAHTEAYAGKVLHIEAGHELSLQHHERKVESILVIEGVLALSVKEGDVLARHFLGPGESFHIPAGTIHRMASPGGCKLVEVSTPELDDVVRHEDAYGRV